MAFLQEEYRLALCRKEEKLTVRLGGGLWPRREALQQTCAPRATPPQLDDPEVCRYAGKMCHGGSSNATRDTLQLLNEEVN